MPPKVHYITIGADIANQRIDNFLRSKYKGLPKSRLYKALRKGEVRVNKKRIQPHYRLQANDEIRVPPLRISEPPKIPVIDRNMRKILQKSILVDNTDFYIIDKPAGLAVHRGSEVAVGLIDAMRQLVGDQTYLQLAHRLDKHTSGCVVIAKNRAFLTYFQNLLKANCVEKQYYALVAGKWPEHVQCINLPLQRIRCGDESHVQVQAAGKSAVTHVTSIRYDQPFSLLDLKIDTGRMHQIRVHLAHYQHPILNDDRYGNKTVNTDCRARGFKRLGLHARQIAFTLKSGQKIVCESAYPAAFRRLVSL